MSTHQQLLYHIVFSTKNRQQWLTDGFREDLFAYMAGIARNIDGHPLIINGYYDHCHVLIRIPAKIAVSDFVGRLKANSSRHINETSETLRKFGWQDGFGAFTVSPSQKRRVYEYVANQMEHHQQQSFETEYLILLERHEVKYDEQYVFD